MPVFLSLTHSEEPRKGLVAHFLMFSRIDVYLYDVDGALKGPL